jgi:diaminopimelate decarboxylase
MVATDLVALAYKGGLSYDEVVQAGNRIMKLPNVDLVGFHQRHGRHSRMSQYWKAQMDAYAREIANVCKALGGYRPQELSIGGGFACPRDPHNAATNYSDPVTFGALHLVSHGLRLFGSAIRYQVINKLLGDVTGKPNAIPAPSIEEYGSVTTSALLAALRKSGIDPTGIMLQLEPGRSIHSDAGVHLTTVQATKRMTSPIRWNLVIVDTSEFWLTGGRFEHHLHDYRVANRLDAPSAIKADVTGRSCYGDRILPALQLPEVQTGDILAMLDTGAYQEVSASNFNAMLRPASVMVTDDQACVIRRAEKLDDVFGRDLLPAHLEQSSGTKSRNLASVPR